MKNKKGEASCFPFLLICERLRLVHAYFDLPRFSLFGFRNMELQYAVFVGGLDSVVLYGFRK
jgi:hypothetical protein